MVGENATHDVRSLLGGLRDHLAQHDRPIAFLFGAGTSCAVRVPSTEDKGETVSLIPNIAGLTKSCEKAAVAQSEKFALAWQKIFLDCKDTKPTPNIEDVLSRLRRRDGVPPGNRRSTTLDLRQRAWLRQQRTP